MGNIVCHICEINLIYKDYTGTKLLNENGEKPCFECFLEDEEENSEDILSQLNDGEDNE